MALSDAFGNAVKLDDLKRENRPVSMMGVHTLLSLNETIGLNPKKLARILKKADEGDADSYLSLAEEIEEKDTHYISVIGTRKRAVAQLEITVEPGGDSEIDKKAAKLIESFMKRPCLESEIFNILDAIGKGYSVSEIIWDDTGDTWLPKDIKWRDPRHFKFSKDDGETLLMLDGDEWVPLPPFKYIVHKHQSKSGLPIRGGVVRPCAWMWLFKNFAIKDWVVFAEAYGQPIRLGKYGSSATQADKDVLMRAVACIGSDAAAIIPESMKIEFIEAQGKTGTADVFDRLMTACDQQISKAVLGQTTTTDAITGGGLAGNQAHNDVRGDIERSDAKQVEATLNEQVIRPIIDLNFGPQKVYPRARIGRAEQVDIEKITQAAERLAKVGAKISASKIVTMVGLPPAENEDDILKPAPTPTTDEATDLATAAAKALDRNDAIDKVVDEMAGEYEEILDPMIIMIQQAADDSDTFEEFKQKLLVLAGEMKIDGLANRLGDASFMARMAGKLEIDLSNEG